MLRRSRVVATGAIVLAAALAAGAGDAPKADWAVNATVIEACSCPMFCQCYFNTEPAAHHEHGGGGKHFCKANNAYRINKGHHGAVKLDGAKFWVSADLGNDFADGEMEWAVLTFDKAVTKEQRDAISTAVLPALFPVKWKSFEVKEGSIDTWRYDKDTAVALLDGGKTGEVRLKRAASGNTPDPIVIHNLKYWGAPRNEGFVLMPNEVEAYRVGPNAFEFKGTNGFMVTFDISSRDAAPAK